MASRKTAEYIVRQLSDAGDVALLHLFGDYGICCDGKLAALLCGEQLFIKPTYSGRAFLRSVTETPPYEDARQCLLVPQQRWDNAVWLSKLFRLSLRELPPVAMKWER